MRTIVHLSDLHFGRLDTRIVEPLLAAVRQISPELVAISGDLTQRARRAQFAEARAFIQALGFPHLVVPGNHDVPLYDVTRRFLRPLARYKRFVAAELEPSHVDDEIAVIGLNSARSLTFGRGRLNHGQIARAVERLRTLDPRVIKIIVTHHPFDLPPSYRSRQLVGRARRAMAVFASCGADILLAGHLHASAAAVSLTGRAIVAQAGTATSTRVRDEPNSFNLLRVARAEVAIERWSWAGGAFQPIAEQRFARSSEGWRAR